MPTRPQCKLVLASRSPRRADLLREAGYSFRVIPSRFVDPPHPEAGEAGGAGEVAVRLAVAKARETPVPHAKGGQSEPWLILAADTLCVGVGGALIGQPADRGEAGAIIRSFAGRSHRVVTGVALLDVNIDQVESFADEAVVELGPLNDVQLDAYLDSGRWRGKAGGYNLYEVQQEGWPIRVQGDPAAVVGLPMRELGKRLQRWELGKW